MTAHSDSFSKERTDSKAGATGDNSGITFSCPHCNQHLSADFDMAGMSLECPACGKALVVPSPREEATPKIRVLGSQKDQTTTRKGRKWRRVAIAILIIAAIVGVARVINRSGLTGNKGAIASVLERDRSIAARAPRCNNPNDVDERIEHTKYIVAQMLLIDLSRCPDDFAQAYDNHRNAWKQMLNVYYEGKQYQLRLGVGCLLVLFNGTAGRNSDFLWGLDNEQLQIAQKWKAADNAIAETFDKVLETATKHGVKTAKYRNPAFQ